MKGGNNIEQNDKNVRTSTLFRRLFKAPDLESFIVKNAEELHSPLFHDYIKGLCYMTKQVPERVIKHASIERTYGHQLFNGTRKPSRDKVIQLAFGFDLDVEGTQNLLRIAQKSLLYPRIKRDAAILYCIKNHIDIVGAQNLLYNLELTLLGGDS